VRPHFLFLGSEGFPPTVYDAQVADHLRVLARAGLVFDVLNFDPLYPQTMLTARGRARVERFRQALPGELRVLPFVPYEDRLGSPVASLQLRAALWRPGPWVVHARGLQAAYMAVRATESRPDVRVVYDVRGDYWAEHRFHWSGRGDDPGVDLRRLQRAEELVCASASRVLAVSEALRHVLDRRHPGVAAKTEVFPCTVDLQKFQLDEAARRSWRAKLGLEGKRVIAYAGSLVAYQLPERLVALGARVTQADPDAHLLLITPHQDRARELLADAGLGSGRATTLAVGHTEMPGLLNAADAGLLLRHPDPVNAVASPTKVAEYLACGVPVLLSAGIGDLSELVARRGVGAVVEDARDTEAQHAALSELLAYPPAREHAHSAAREELARDVFVPRYLQLYRGLAAGSDASSQPRRSRS
jgi:glycosyltransferase involved in cell wall biosynthesis